MTYASIFFASLLQKRPVFGGLLSKRDPVMQRHSRLFSLQESLIIVGLFSMIMLEAYTVVKRLQHSRSAFAGTNAWNLAFWMCVRAPRVTHRGIIMAVKKNIGYTHTHTHTHTHVHVCVYRTHTPPEIPRHHNEHMLR